MLNVKITNVDVKYDLFAFTITEHYNFYIYCRIDIT